MNMSVLDTNWEDLKSQGLVKLQMPEASLLPVDFLRHQVRSNSIVNGWQMMDLILCRPTFRPESKASNPNLAERYPLYDLAASA